MKHKIEKNTVQETLVIPLYGRKVCSERYPDLYRDPEACALMDRIHTNYRNIIGFNFMLICLGVAGILPPATSALLHNAYTLTVSLRSMTRLLPPAEIE